MSRSIFRLFVAVFWIFSALCVPSAHAGTLSDTGGSVHPEHTQLSSQALLFQDDFEDDDYTVADGANGLTWSLIAGDASVDDVDGSLQLGVDRGISLIATDQRIAGDEYTLRFDGRITWSAPGRIVVLYKDADNYYPVGLGEQPGIYRKLNGSEVQLHRDPESVVRLPHGSAETGAFKVYAHNTGSSIVVKADEAGDGVDYDIEIVDADPAAVAMFTQTGVGMMSGGGEPYSRWFYLDNVAIYEGLVVDPRTQSPTMSTRAIPSPATTTRGRKACPGGRSKRRRIRRGQAIPYWSRAACITSGSRSRVGAVGSRPGDHVQSPATALGDDVGLLHALCALPAHRRVQHHHRSLPDRMDGAERCIHCQRSRRGDR